MKLQNKNKSDEIDDISNWLISNFKKLKGKPLSVEVNQSGKINFIETSVKLNDAELKKITDKYPELQ